MMRVAGGVMLGLVEQRTLPVYPDEAMRKGIQGDVVFKIVVDETRSDRLGLHCQPKEQVTAQPQSFPSV